MNFTGRDVRRQSGAVRQLHIVSGTGNENVVYDKLIAQHAINADGTWRMERGFFTIPNAS